jgi:hypothetical protein
MDDVDRVAVLRKHVGDMLALERHVAVAVERQRSSSRLAELPEAGVAVTAVDRLLARQISALEHYLRGFSGESRERGGLKSTVTRLTGALAGIYDRMREHEVSRMLRDDYTALSLVAVSYEMLHTSALALHEPNLAQLTLAHLQEITPTLSELARVIPHVVASELGGGAEVASEAERNARAALAHN